MRLYHGKYWHPQILVEEELATPAITQINPQHHQGQTHHSMYSIHCQTHHPVLDAYPAPTITLYFAHIWMFWTVPKITVYIVQSSKRVEDGLADRSNEVWAGI